MKTPYNEIVNIASIGSQTNPISLNEILRKANDEQLTPAAQNKERVLFLGIDVQQDFINPKRHHYALWRKTHRQISNRSRRNCLVGIWRHLSMATKRAAADL